MSSEEDKPPAPPVRLTSNRGGSDRSDSVPPVDMRPLPKGLLLLFFIIIKKIYIVCDHLITLLNVLILYLFTNTKILNINNIFVNNNLWLLFCVLCARLNSKQSLMMLIAKRKH